MNPPPPDNPPPDRLEFRAFFPSSRLKIFFPRPGRRGSHTTARELQTCTFQGPGASKHHQNSTNGPQERERRKKIVAGGGKKSGKFWAPHPWGLPPFGASTLRGLHPSGPPPFGAHFSRPHFFWVCSSTLGASTLGVPTLCGPKTQHPEIGRSRNWPKTKAGRSRNWPKSIALVFKRGDPSLPTNFQILASVRAVLGWSGPLHRQPPWGHHHIERRGSVENYTTSFQNEVSSPGKCWKALNWRQEHQRRCVCCVPDLAHHMIHCRKTFWDMCQTWTQSQVCKERSSGRPYKNDDGTSPRSPGQSSTHTITHRCAETLSERSGPHQRHRQVRKVRFAEAIRWSRRAVARTIARVC